MSRILARPGRGVWRHHFVAGGQDSHAGALGHDHLGEAQGQQPAQILRPQNVPGREDLRPLGHVLAHLQHILPRGHGANNLNLLRAGRLGMFYLHHRVGAVGQHAAGVNDDRLPRPQGQRRRLPHGHLAHNLQQGGQCARRAVGVGGAHGVTIHGAAAEGGQGVRGEDGGGRDPAGGLGSGDGLGRGAPGEMLKEQRPRRSGREDVEELRHGVVRTRRRASPPAAPSRWPGPAATG